MQVLQDGANIRLEFNYSPTLVKKVAGLPGAKFHKDALQNYWTIPTTSLNMARTAKIISDGNLYPGAVSYLQTYRFRNLLVEAKFDRIKASGPITELVDFKQSFFDLCSYEDKEEDEDKTEREKEYIIKTLAEEIWFKNNIMVIKFPKGLYSRVVGYLNQFKYRQFIKHPYPSEPQKSLDITTTGFTPRSYQQKACDRIMKKKISNRATLVMATGSGKTMLSALITANLGVPTIFYTYSRELLRQTAEVYESVLNQEIGRIGGNRFTIKPITVASIQTVYSCWEKQDARWDKLSPYLDSVQCMFIDEGHGLGADTIFKAAEITDAYYSYALTATPFREDGKEIFIEAGSGPTVELISEQELVAGGYVLPVKVEMHLVQHYMSRKKNYHKLYDSEIIDHWERNRTIVKAVRKYQGKQIVVLVKEIDHGKRIAEVLNVPFIHGSTSSKERKEVLDKFKNRVLNIIVASSILKQGIDIPEAEVLVLAHGGTSLVELMQKVGRVRRPASGKKYGIVVDFYDYILPVVDDDIFKNQAERRLAFYKSRQFEISKCKGA